MNLAIILDGFPSDAAQKSTKNSERICRANHSSPDIIFDETTTLKIAQDKVLANDNNKKRFIELLKKSLQISNIQVQQAVEDADLLIVNTAISMASQYDLGFSLEKTLIF